MADTSIVYPLDNPYGAILADVVAKFNEAKDRMHQFRNIVTTFGDDPDVETKMGMAHDLYYAYSMKLILDAVLVHLDEHAADMARMDKGL